MPKSNFDVILVRGAPGVGKTSAMKHLRAHLAGGAIIEVDHVRGMIADVRWTDRAHHNSALAVVEQSIRAFLNEGHRPVVVVDTFHRGVLDPFLRSLDGLSYHVASLFASPDVLRRRIEGRADKEYKDWDVSRQLNEQVMGIRLERELVIDTTERTPAGVSEILAKLIHGDPP